MDIPTSIPTTSDSVHTSSTLMVTSPPPRSFSISSSIARQPVRTCRLSGLRPFRLSVLTNRLSLITAAIITTLPPKSSRAVSLCGSRHHLDVTLHARVIHRLRSLRRYAPRVLANHALVRLPPDARSHTRSLLGCAHFGLRLRDQGVGLPAARHLRLATPTAPLGP